MRLPRLPRGPLEEAHKIAHVSCGASPRTHLTHMCAAESERGRERERERDRRRKEQVSRDGERAKKVFCIHEDCIHDKTIVVFAFCYLILLVVTSKSAISFLLLE